MTDGLPHHIKQLNLNILTQTHFTKKTTKEIEDAIAIPSEAIVPEMGKNKVFVYRSGVADPVDVIIGLRTEAEVQIVRGLSVGDTILTSGTLQLRKGMPVELQAIN